MLNKNTACDILSTTRNASKLSTHAVDENHGSWSKNNRSIDDKRENNFRLYRLL